MFYVTLSIVTNSKALVQAMQAFILDIKNKGIVFSIFFEGVLSMINLKKKTLILNLRKFRKYYSHITNV